MKAVDIPPPRPKRKPSHPYPRKFGNSSIKETTTLKKLEKSLSATEVVPDLENESVLSATCSDKVESSASDIQNYSTSSDSSTNSTNQVSLEYAKKYFPAEGAKEFQSTPSASDTLTFEGKSGMETDAVSRATSIQLFGKTVLIADSSNTSASMTGTDIAYQRSSPCTNDEEGSPRNFCDTASKESWSPWSCEVPPMFYYLPSQVELIGASQGAWNPMPLWACYGSPPFSSIQPSNFGLQRFSSSPKLQEAFLENKVGTNALQSTPQSRSAFRSLKSTSGNQRKGFMPYTRCLSRKTLDTDEDRQSKGIRLCL